MVRKWFEHRHESRIVDKEKKWVHDGADRNMPRESVKSNNEAI